MTARSPVVLGADGLLQQLQPGTDSLGAIYPIPTSVGASTYTVQATDYDIIFSVACTVTLPTVASSKGRELFMKTIAATAVISNASNVKPLTSNTAGTAILAATAGKWVRMICDGASWIVMAGA